MADELRRSSFEVDIKENLGKEEMRRAIDAFLGKIRKDMVALFYFGGSEAGERPIFFPSTHKSGAKPICGGRASASSSWWRI